MTIKFPRTYKDLKEAEYIYDVEVCDSGVFIYIWFTILTSFYSPR